MNAQTYLEKKLEELKQPVGTNFDDISKLDEKIYQLLTSKKYRKFALSEELKRHVKDSIALNVDNNQPINITFLHGAYKLWRLEESPNVDWAELFALMRYINWVKPVCELYKPGVIMDFFVDDYIIPMLNNIQIQDVDAYIKSYKDLLDFLAAYKPNNLIMKISTVGEQFDTLEAFHVSMQNNLKKLEREQGDNLPELTPQIESMIDLNVKVTDEQKVDPNWKAKVWNLHNAYSMTKAEPSYHKNRPDKILAFTSSLPMAIGVGTTKRAIMKFWVGVGVLRPDDEDFDQDILSPKQLESSDYEWEDVSLNGLLGKNFKRIRILK